MTSSVYIITQGNQASAGILLRVRQIMKPVNS